MYNVKGQYLGIRGLWVACLLLVMAVASVDTPARLSAHGGDVDLIHACVNDINAETLIVHPGPGNADIDCVNPPWPLGAGWSPLDLSTWSGAGTGSLSPANLTDNVGIGTTSPNEQLEITRNFRLPATTAATGIIMSDGNPFIHNFGTNNLFAGVNAGNLTMTGSSNTGVGADAVQLNTTGNNNTAVGALTLRSNTTGGENTAAGVRALFSNTTGSKNTATGMLALKANTTGDENTADGRGALEANTTGTHNTAAGFLALWSNTTGFDNTATGRGALEANATGTLNTAAGAVALVANTTGSGNAATGSSALWSNTTGFNNTASGTNALHENTTGGSNTAAGFGALTSNTTGSFNTGIGRSVDVSQGDLTNATAIGANAVVDASNKIRLSDTAVTVVETAGDVFVETQGLGITLRNTDGAGCHRITINSAGTLSAAVVACP